LIRKSFVLQLVATIHPNYLNLPQEIETVPTTFPMGNNFIQTPHGRIINRGFASDNHELAKEFHLRDHLGNTRMVLEEIC